MKSVKKQTWETGITTEIVKLRDDGNGWTNEETEAQKRIYSSCWIDHTQNKLMNLLDKTTPAKHQIWPIQ